MAELSEKVKRARAAVEASEERVRRALDALESADENIGDEDLAALNAEFDEAETERSRAQDTLAREERIAEARASLPAPVAGGVTVTKDEDVYRRDGSNSFFADMIAARKGDAGAYERLHRNDAQVRDARKARGEARANADGSGFQPPIYLADEWVKVRHPGRALADQLRKIDLPAEGMTITVPKLSTATSVAFHADGGNVSNTAGGSTTLTEDIYMIAGYNDVDRLVLERSNPGFDMVLLQDLRALYDSTLDAKLLNGSGSGEFLGLDNVSGINTVDASADTGSQKGVLADIYKAVSKIRSSYYGAPDLIVMHPRRAAWLASGFDTSFPIFNQGGMNTFQIASQDDGVAGEIAGMKVVIDANVPTNEGAGTDEDPIYVVASNELLLAEEGVQSATFQEVASGTLAIRVQLWGAAAAILDRYPKAIAKLTGLTAPTGF